MPGSYAHITLVNLASEKRFLQKIINFPREAINAANLHSNYLSLGSISPDYPYLDFGSGDSKEWADKMHYTHTGQAVFVGAELVRQLPSGQIKDKCLAWLMGFSAHVFTDMFIHPVVKLRVGPYSGNETGHRRCEMHQDAYIFRRMGLGMPQVSNFVESTILTCCDKEDPKKLDPDLKSLWEELLKRVHPDLFSRNLPDLDVWHERCRKILEKLLPTTSNLIGFARHVCDGLAFSYPTPDEIDKSYIENLAVPIQKIMNYDEIFDAAIALVRKSWVDVTRQALFGGNIIAYGNDEWDLDEGCNKSDQDKLVFWRVV